MLETTHRVAPHVIDRYLLCERLGQGGVANVWKAFDQRLQRYVAIKMLLKPSSPEATLRFIKEAKAMAGLYHPNIAQVYDVSPSTSAIDVDDYSVAYVTIRYVEGESLTSYISRTLRFGLFPSTDEILYIMFSLARAIDYAHEQGVIHCNIKPANVLLDRENSIYAIGDPVLTDFGLVSVYDDVCDNTRGGDHLIELPFYFAPELIQGGKPSISSDLYALGVILYELCTGRYPFEFSPALPGQRPVSSLRQQVMLAPVPPSFTNPDISPGLEAVIMRAIAKVPSERYPNALALVSALERALHAPTRYEVVSEGVQGGRVSDKVPERPGVSEAYLKRKVPFAFLPFRKRHSWPLLLVSTFMVSLMLLGMFVFGPISSQRRQPLPGMDTLGQVLFLNSELGVATNNGGVNDEVQVQLSHIPQPAPGKRYYAWLLGDTDRSDSQVILLGKLFVDPQGNAYLDVANPRHAYIDPQHSNLLAVMSRFLITEEVSQFTPTFPSPDQSTWRFFGAISQTPNPQDQNHYSLLDHLRHLLAVDPSLDALDMRGGLSVWLFRNTGLVRDLAQSADAGRTVQSDLVQILDYIDGADQVSQDVPAGTPVLANFSRIGLVQTHAYQNSSSYLYHVGLHLSGLTSSPGISPEQVQMASSIVKDLNTVNQLLKQARTITIKLIRMPVNQYSTSDAKQQLAMLAHLTKIAYNGQDNMLHGVVWIHEQVSQLARIMVTSYKVS